MNVKTLDLFLQTIDKQLPEVISDADLIGVLPRIFKSQSTLSRMRTAKQAPPHFHISKTCVRYLKADILNWLRTHYQYQDLSEESNIPHLNNINGRLDYLESKIEEICKWKALVDVSLIDISNRLES